MIPDLLVGGDLAVLEVDGAVLIVERALEQNDGAIAHACDQVWRVALVSALSASPKVKPTSEVSTLL